MVTGKRIFGSPHIHLAFLHLPITSGVCVCVCEYSTCPILQFIGVVVGFVFVFEYRWTEREVNNSASVLIVFSAMLKCTKNE